jgi:hypothetical protein
LNLSLPANPPNRRRKPNRHEAEQFEFIFPGSKNAGARFRQLEFPWLLRPPKRTKRRNFSQFKRLCALLRAQNQFKE